MLYEAIPQILIVDQVWSKLVIVCVWGGGGYRHLRSFMGNYQHVLQAKTFATCFLPKGGLAH